jgi:hypothetical protein
MHRREAELIEQFCRIVRDYGDAATRKPTRRPVTGSIETINRTWSRS